MNDASYTSDLSTKISQFANSFGDAEEISVTLEEVLLGSKNISKNIAFSDDGKKISIIYKTSKYLIKGKVQSLPTPAEVYKGLNFVLNKAVKEYASKYPESQDGVAENGNDNA